MTFFFSAPAREKKTILQTCNFSFCLSSLRALLFYWLHSSLTARGWQKHFTLICYRHIFVQACLLLHKRNWALTCAVSHLCLACCNKHTNALALDQPLFLCDNPFSQREPPLLLCLTCGASFFFFFIPFTFSCLLHVSGDLLLPLQQNATMPLDHVCFIVRGHWRFFFSSTAYHQFFMWTQLKSDLLNLAVYFKRKCHTVQV